MNRMIALIASLLLSAASARADDGAMLKAGVFDPPRAAPDFSLQGSNG